MQYAKTEAAVRKRLVHQTLLLHCTIMERMKRDRKKKKKKKKKKREREREREREKDT